MTVALKGQSLLHAPLQLNQFRSICLIQDLRIGRGIRGGEFQPPNSK